MRTSLIIVLALLPLGGCAGVQLPHKKMSYAEACPGFQNVKCAPDDDPKQLRFNLVTPVLETLDGKPAYDRFLGRVFAQPYRRGMIGQYCNTSPQVLFTPADIDTESATSSFAYKYKLESNLGANADVDLVQALTTAGLPPASMEQVKAAAKAAYKRAKNREVETRGRALLVRLKSDVVQELMCGTGARLAPCRHLIRSNPDRAMIKAMTVFHIEDASSSTNIDDQIIADIHASLAGTGAANIGSVQTALTRTVQEQIKTAIRDRYLVWSVTWLRADSR